MKTGRPKKAKTYITSLRVSKLIKSFLESQENANEYVVNLITESENFKLFASKVDEDDPKQTKLF